MGAGLYRTTVYERLDIFACIIEEFDSKYRKSFYIYVAQVNVY